MAVGMGNRWPVHINLVIPPVMAREIEAMVGPRYVTRSEVIRRLLVLGLEAEKREFGEVGVGPEPLKLKGVG